MAVTDKVSRPTRALGQGGTSWIIVELVDAFFFDLTDRQFGALVAGLTVAISWAQVVIENWAGVGFLRKPEPPAKKVEPIEGAPGLF